MYVMGSSTCLPYRHHTIHEEAMKKETLFSQRMRKTMEHGGSVKEDANVYLMLDSGFLSITECLVHIPHGNVCRLNAFGSRAWFSL